ncbi:helix-turn-helix domain-containing protein [Oecophyllibacter saccharovorans]|uniref:helix-turn-helix domain-containing protein n=1 Tax=Oecophyllibacter saccharovorans TaxID=2558360 RepID=UPI00116A8B57|nr:helix-turn-helix domain-containing protein [Oecophyllibacter saccharovorans]TPW36384.1 nitrogen assimilation regulator [Oecophyllibacter saccharovorans]
MTPLPESNPLATQAAEAAPETENGSDAASASTPPPACGKTFSLFLHGATAELRLEVARSLHQHGPHAAGPFVQARLTEEIRVLREEALFGCEEKQCPGWIAQAAGGTLLIDEIDCLDFDAQRALARILQAPTPAQRLFVASRHTPQRLLETGTLCAELQVWLSRLEGRHCLGPERLRAVWQLQADPDSTRASDPSGSMGGLAVVLDQAMQGHVEAALETGVQMLHASVVAAVEQPLLTRVLQHTQGNQLRAAAILGLNRNTLRKRLQALGIALRPKA